MSMTWRVFYIFVLKNSNLLLHIFNRHKKGDWNDLAPFLSVLTFHNSRWGWQNQYISRQHLFYNAVCVVMNHTTTSFLIGKAAFAKTDCLVMQTNFFYCIATVLCIVHKCV